MTVYLTHGKDPETDAPVVVIDGVGSFPVDRLDEIVAALVELQKAIVTSPKLGSATKN